MILSHPLINHTLQPRMVEYLHNNGYNFVIHSYNYHRIGHEKIWNVTAKLRDALCLQRSRNVFSADHLFSKTSNTGDFVQAYGFYDDDGCPMYQTFIIYAYILYTKRFRRSQRKEFDFISERVFVNIGSRHVPHLESIKDWFKRLDKTGKSGIMQCFKKLLGSTPYCLFQREKIKNKIKYYLSDSTMILEAGDPEIFASPDSISGIQEMMDEFNASHPWHYNHKRIHSFIIDITAKYYKNIKKDSYDIPTIAKIDASAHMVERVLLSDLISEKETKITATEKYSVPNYCRSSMYLDVDVAKKKIQDIRELRNKLPFPLYLNKNHGQSDLTYRVLVNYSNSYNFNHTAIEDFKQLCSFLRRRRIYPHVVTSRKMGLSYIFKHNKLLLAGDKGTDAFCHHIEKNTDISFQINYLSCTDLSNINLLKLKGFEITGVEVNLSKVSLAYKELKGYTDEI